MGKEHRVEVPGGTFHVGARGNGRAAIFVDELDYTEFLRNLATVVADCGWLCHACCLMPNHYHLLLGTPEPNLAVGMHRLNGRYARRFNRRHGRIGHVFQAPYFSELVTDDEYLMELFRYIALNPVRAGLSTAAEDWPWSTYAATAGLAEAPSFLMLDLARSVLGGPDGIRRFIADGANGRYLV